MQSHRETAENSSNPKRRNDAIPQGKEPNADVKARRCAAIYLVRKNPRAAIQAWTHDPYIQRKPTGWTGAHTEFSSPDYLAKNEASRFSFPPTNLCMNQLE